MATKKTKKPTAIDAERTARVNSDFFAFARECLKIQNEKGELVPFELRSIQKKILARVLFGPDFIIKRWMVLKPRQIGATSLHWAIVFWLAITREDHKALIIAHEEDLAADILQRVRLAYEQLPDWYDKPKLAKDSSAALSFQDTRSAIFIGTAGTARKGSSAKLGRTYQSIYATELADAKWERVVIMRLLQCAHEGAIVMLDSTANGAQGWYYEEWGKAKDGKSNFLPLFYRWDEHEEYRREADPTFARTAQEEELARQLGLENDQLAWRRWKLNELSEDEFDELYPVNDVDCFILSGSPCFSPTDLQFFRTSEDHCKDWPTLRGSIQRVVS